MPKVTIYFSPTCPHCHNALAFLDDKKVKYTKLSVDEDKNAHEAVEVSGQMGVPVIVVENDGKKEIIVGFDPEKISSALGL